MREEERKEGGREEGGREGRKEGGREGGVEKERGRTKGGERWGREIGERKEGERRSEGKTKKEEEISVHSVPQHTPTHQCHHLGVDERDRLTQVHGEGGVHQPTLLIQSNDWGCEGR